MDCLAIKEELTSSSIICRLCLVQNSNYYEVFGENHDRPEIADVLRSLLGISISPLDNWPKSICTGCVDKVFDFQTLQTRAKDNEMRLVEVFGEYQLLEKILSRTASPVAYPEFQDEVKVEAGDDSIKEEESDMASDCASLVNVQIKEESTQASEEPRKRGRPKKVLRKRGRKRKVPPPESEDEDGQTDDKEKPSEAEKESEEAIRQKKEERRLRDEKVDAEIHTFFKMECVLCQLHFPKFTDVQAHFRAAHKCRGYVVCCGKKLNRPMKLYEHMNDHINPTKHQCPICQKYYKTQGGLQVHKRLQHTPPEQRKFHCDKCPQSFAISSALTAHMISHMAPEEKSHVCETCGQTFALKTILVQHVRRVHENACVSVCEICAKVFRSKNIFDKHMAEHTDITRIRVPCNICGKMFKHRIAMQRHRYRHNTSGSLECPICQRVAPNRQALHEHVKYNHRDRKKFFPCNLCERVFKTRVSLKEHMASHTGQVLYQCLFCPKQFNSNANYFRHMKMSHPQDWEAEKEKRRVERASQSIESKSN
uniref:Uncharacterized protein n=1 Tax=Phlebotomus papatasi TaxID=29031 RepID=A0A1B0DE08_PHLPP